MRKNSSHLPPTPHSHLSCPPLKHGAYLHVLTLGVLPPEQQHSQLTTTPALTLPNNVKMEKEKPQLLLK